MTKGKCIKVWQMTEEQIQQRNREVLERNKKELDQFITVDNLFKRNDISRYELDECIQNNNRGIQRSKACRSNYDRGTKWIRICSYGNTHLSDETDQDSYYYEFNQYELDD
jgi:hypothetical protein